MKIKVIDNSAKFKKQLATNINSALSRLGSEWESVVREEIERQPRMGPMAGAAMGAVDSGFMRDSNTHRVDFEKRELIVGNPLNYALYTTFGTWKMEARPWMQNSVLNHGDRYMGVVVDALRKGIST